VTAARRARHEPVAGAADAAADAATVADADGLAEALQRFVGMDSGSTRMAHDEVNLPMIRHWCDAMGDTNPVYTQPEEAEASVHGEIVAPPTMLQAWTMRGLHPGVAPDDRFAEMMTLLDENGFTSVVATNSHQEYERYLRLGDRLTETAVIEAVSERKQTALGEGYFVTTRRTWYDQQGELVGTMVWRILKFRPRHTVSSQPAGRQSASAQPAPTKPATPHPAVNRDSAFFWEGTAVGELRIQRCRGCNALRHPPGPVCAPCGSYEWDHVVASGRGTIFSFVVQHHPPVPGQDPPFVVVLVDLEEGTRIIGNLIDADPADISIGDAVRVAFVPVDGDLVLPQWRREPVS
jgi:hypothetical protein